MSSTPYSSLFDVWSRTSSQWFESVKAANRAAAAAFGVPASARGNGCSEPPGDVAVEDRLEPAADLSEWEVELNTDPERDLAVGDRVRFTKTLTAADVERFAAASGDTNPLHLDEGWAEDTRFNGRIVHGTLAAGLISAALARLPGGVIYLSQDVEFRAPVRIGDRVSAVVEVVEDLGDDRYRLRTTVRKDDDVVIDGEAMVLIDDL